MVRYKDKLAVFDVSWLLHYGGNISDKYYGESYYRRLHVAGIKYFLHRFATEYVYGSNIVFCFDSKTDKKSRVKNYKSHRKFPIHVYAQADILYKFLSDGGWCCLKREGAEADDLIYSIVEDYHETIKDIKIISNDRDLAHNIRHNVRLDAVSVDFFDINYYNYEKVVFPNHGVKYNTVSAYHALVEDVSDNTGAYFMDSGEGGIKLYRKFVEYLQSFEDKEKYDSYYGRHPLTLRMFIKDQMNGTQEDLDRLEDHIYVSYPKKYICEEVPTHFTEVKEDGVGAIAKLLTLTNSKKLEEKFKIYKQSLTKEEENFVLSFGGSLVSVDNFVNENGITPQNIVEPIRPEGIMVRVFEDESDKTEVFKIEE